MSAKFTKGPWVAICPEQRLLVGESKEHDITSYEVMSEKTRGELTAEGATHYRKDEHNVDNISIAQSYWRDMSNEEAKANASLIACAPELYKMLEVAAKNMPHSPIGYRINKLLAKARGEA